MLKRNAIFLIMSLLLFIVAGLGMAIMTKAEMHLWLNSYHNAGLDIFFKYYTQVGEWIPYVAAAGLLFYKAGWSAYLLVSIWISGLIAQGLKQLLELPRPLYYFMATDPGVQLQVVEGVKMSGINSFPSGHTTTFFSMFLVISILLTDVLYYQKPSLDKKAEKVSNQRNQKIRRWLVYLVVPFTCFIAAILGAYSRIYLNLHFLEDIYAGAIIGICSTLSLYLLIPRIKGTRFWDWKMPYLWTKEPQKG